LLNCPRPKAQTHKHKAWVRLLEQANLIHPTASIRPGPSSGGGGRRATARQGRRTAVCGRRQGQAVSRPGPGAASGRPRRAAGGPRPTPRGQARRAARQVGSGAEAGPTAAPSWLHRGTEQRQGLQLRRAAGKKTKGKHGWSLERQRQEIRHC